MLDERLGRRILCTVMFLAALAIGVATTTLTTFAQGCNNNYPCTSDQGCAMVLNCGCNFDAYGVGKCGRTQ